MQSVQSPPDAAEPREGEYERRLPERVRVAVQEARRALALYVAACEDENIPCTAALAMRFQNKTLIVGPVGSGMSFDVLSLKAE